jgi:hypothetical protein
MNRPGNTPLQRVDAPCFTRPKLLLVVKPSWIHEAVRSGALPGLRIRPANSRRHDARAWLHAGA